MWKYCVQTFGCAMNQADSEKINMVLLQSGFIKAASWEEADIIVFNTCSVRKKWEDKVFSFINEVTKFNTSHNKSIKIGVTGCMIRKTGIGSKYNSEIHEKNRAKKIEILRNENDILNNDDELFQRAPSIDFTLRIEETKYLPLILSHVYGKKIGQDDKFADYLKQAQQRENPFSASVIAQTGCDNYCTYCIVPYTRGKEESRTKEDIVEECKVAVQNWAKEITIIGQNVNSYGKQSKLKLWNSEESRWNESIEKSPFRELLEGIDTIPWIDRIRFTSSNPHDMTKDILDAHFDLNHTCNYLHFALQSGSNEMLKKMNRRHTYEDFKRQVDYLRSRDPFFSVSTDIIVGFSGETDEMFEETIRAFHECQFDYAYIARYSVRKGTIAEKLMPDNVPDTIKAERWHLLNNILLEHVLLRNEKMIGKTEDVLVAWEKDDFFFGRTRNFKEVFFEKDTRIKIGDIIPVKITELDKYVLKWVINLKK